MSRSAISITQICLGIILACLNASVQAEDDLAQQAKGVLERHCYVCHGKDGVAEAGLNILNWDRLLASGESKVVPKNPSRSDLLQLMLDGSMPPEDDERAKTRPSEQEILIVRRWIVAGASNFNEVIQRKFISPQQMIDQMATDLEKNVRERDRKFARYFTLTHLYNAGFPDDEIETYRLAISNLINSLSWERAIVIPKPIDPEKTIFRIDLRDFKWDAQSRYNSTSQPAWDLLVAASPYNVTYESPRARYCYDQTLCQIPCIRGDWFVAAASCPPLYHEILEIPGTDQELERRLEVNVAANIARERVARAGFTRSGVSDNNRLIERHRSAHGAYWKSYDFAGNIGRQLLTSHPLGPGEDSSFFKHDGGEIIFNLPNGFQAYMLIKADGKRIEKGPTNIVRDDLSRDNGAVVNGISCMRCHHQGMVRKDDEIRGFVQANTIIFKDSPNLAEQITELYPEKVILEQLYNQDAERHIKAAGEAGSPISRDEKTKRLQLKDGMPVVRLARQFNNELDARLAAAEAGVELDSLKQLLQQSPELARQLGLLLVAGKTVKRDTYVAAFGLLTTELRVGRFVPPTELRSVSIAESTTSSLPPTERRPENLIVNSISMKLALIPSGTFTMGSKEDEDNPPHQVNITKSFYMGQTEVTQSQWTAVMETTPWKGYSRLDNRKNYPASVVTWADATEFCRKLSAKEGKTYRLPTEAEWEYACRAGSTTKFSFGDSDSSLGEYAWYKENKEGYVKTDQEVAQKRANAYSLYDMHGSVEEWCSDWKGTLAKDKSPVDDPKGPSTGDEHVARGGSSNSEAFSCRSAYRGWSLRDASADRGFRVVLEQ